MTRSDGDELATLLARTRHLLLDFDGPMCAVFAGRGARDVAIELLDAMSSEHVQIPDDVAAATDPFDVLRYAATVGPELAERIEQQLRAAELEAIRTATPTPHTTDVITAWHQAGRTVAAVSNNSAAAVQTYLTSHGIHVDAIAARTSPDPALLKPSPHLLTQALRALNAQPFECTLVGDSVSDIAAARRAGVASIGYANKAGKHTKLSHAGATVVIDDISAMLQHTTSAV